MSTRCGMEVRIEYFFMLRYCHLCFSAVWLDEGQCCTFTLLSDKDQDHVVMKERQTWMLSKAQVRAQNT